MTDITRLLERAHQGDKLAYDDLLPILYDELRTLATQHMLNEQPGHTLQPTALVHEAWLRLVGNQKFDSRGHFFAAASQAMRRVLVDSARRKQRQKRGGQSARLPLDPNELSAPVADDELLALNQALEQLASEQPRCARLVELRFFSGMTHLESADYLGISRATAERDWAYARAWLYDAMEKQRLSADSKR